MGQIDVSRVFPGWRILVAVLVLGMGAPAQAAKSPNVVLIMVDDLNTDVGFLGRTWAATPQLDRLAARSLVFTNAHCQAPICGPSRNSLLTGRFPHSTGLYGLEPLYRDVPALKEIKGLPQWFREHGYHTAVVSKIYHGKADPLGQDQFLGGFGFGPFPKEPLALTPGLKVNAFYDFGEYLTDPETTDVAVASKAGEVLKSVAQSDQPFFLAVGFMRPHCPLYAPKRWFDLHPLSELPPYNDKADDLVDLPAYSLKLIPAEGKYHQWLLQEDRGRRFQQAYRASVSYVDSCIGLFLETLRAQGLEKNTVVVLASDQGVQNGQKNQWFKRTLWEATTRVPLLVSLPGQTESRRFAAPVGLIDLFPTLTDLAGLPRPEGLEGRSLVPLINGRERAEDRPPALTSHGPGNIAVRDLRWRYIRYADGSEELYDHTNDPEELRNVASDPTFAPERKRLSGFVPSSWADFAPGTKGLGSPAFPGL